MVSLIDTVHIYNRLVQYLVLLIDTVHIYNGGHSVPNQCDTQSIIYVKNVLISIYVHKDQLKSVFVLQEIMTVDACRESLLIKCTGTCHSNTVLLYNYRSLQAVIERIDTNAHDLQSLHTIVQSKHSTSLDDRETAAKTRDQQLTSWYLTIINTGSGCLLLLYC